MEKYTAKDLEKLRAEAKDRVGFDKLDDKQKADFEKKWDSYVSSLREHDMIDEKGRKSPDELKEEKQKYKDKYNYDKLSDDDKQKFDDSWDDYVGKLRDKGLTDGNTASEEDEGDDPESGKDNGREREPGAGSKEKKENEKEKEVDPEYKQLYNEIPKNAEAIENAKKKENDRADKKDSYDYDR